MDIDPQIAAALGFPKAEYTSVERERRWLCRQVPHERVSQTEAIVDLYVTNSCLRLREARPTDGGAAMLRLSRKADVDKYTRLITSIYLPEEEFSIVAASLSGHRIRKLRHRLHCEPGVMMLVDEFQGNLAGLYLAEVECKTQCELDAFEIPDFAIREVTGDPRFTGCYLAINGLPGDLRNFVSP